MQLWLFLSYTQQHPFLLSNSFVVSTFTSTMRDPTSIFSFSWGDLNLSHLPAPKHKTMGQSYTIKHFQSPVGCLNWGQLYRRSVLSHGPARDHTPPLPWEMAAPSFRCPHKRTWPVGDPKPPAELWEASWLAELWAKYTPSWDTGCNVPSESKCYRPLVEFFIFSYWHN